MLLDPPCSMSLFAMSAAQASGGDWRRMPANASYPGVDVEEISGSSPVVTSVSTATAAFVGFARRGPLNGPVRVSSFPEYERYFGRLSRDGALGFAAYQFFGNGGACG